MIHPKNHHKCFARLACVKHAASVHPEPGSNSLKKFVQDQIFAWLNFIPFYLLWFCSLRTKFFWTFKDMSLFSYQGSWFVAVSAATSLLYQALFCLSRTFLTFFKSFFDVLFSNLLSEYWFYHWFSLLSRTFFIFLNFSFYSNDSKKYGEGGIWTLAPRERSTPLAGAPLQPLEYFSRYIAFSFE